ncbi:hypothetical protein X777_12595 [Ooceraea biroi]|uniref:Uncharacterized protein n=1 Tax=Ooceraea biroi TaxID=2015173 RepID=A0A026W0S6_OOCBI|nr:hypothetical protein X777_12595 [Ooceraea biroi]
MAILLLDRWLQPPLPPPSLPPATLSTLPTSFELVHSACHRYDEPIAHSEKIFNHASRTWPVTVVAAEESKRKREREEGRTKVGPMAKSEISPSPIEEMGTRGWLWPPFLAQWLLRAR